MSLGSESPKVVAVGTSTQWLNPPTERWGKALNPLPLFLFGVSMKRRGFLKALGWFTAAPIAAKALPAFDTSLPPVTKADIQTLGNTIYQMFVLPLTPA